MLWTSPDYSGEMRTRFYCIWTAPPVIINWLNSHGIKFITKDEWLPNSPELAPMDYFANGHLKQMMRKRLYTTARGMIRAAKEEWSKTPLEMFQNAHLAWPERSDLVNKAKGDRVAL